MLIGYPWCCSANSSMSSCMWICYHENDSFSVTSFCPFFNIVLLETLRPLYRRHLSSTHASNDCNDYALNFNTFIQSFRFNTTVFTVDRDLCFGDGSGNFISAYYVSPFFYPIRHSSLSRGNTQGNVIMWNYNWKS